jgi:hypothetical protein
VKFTVLQSLLKEFITVSVHHVILGRYTVTHVVVHFHYYKLLL